jgi:hypothetical protein
MFRFEYYFLLTVYNCTIVRIIINELKVCSFYKTS